MDTIGSLVSTGALNHGNGNSLVSKLQAAISHINKGNTNAARNGLHAFINEVNADMNSGKLSGSQGAALITDAETVLALLV